MTHDRNDEREDAPQVLPADLDTAGLPSIPIRGNAIGTTVGITAVKDMVLKDAMPVSYPPMAYWTDLDATSKNDEFALLQAQTLMLCPLKQGLYRIDFYTTILASETSVLQIWLFRQPQLMLRYAVLSVAAGQSVDVAWTRYAHMTGSSSIYVTMRLLSGTARVWHGADADAVAPAYSGLYMAKV